MQHSKFEYLLNWDETQKCLDKIYYRGIENVLLHGRMNKVTGEVLGIEFQSAPHESSPSTCDADAVKSVCCAPPILQDLLQQR